MLEQTQRTPGLEIPIKRAQKERDWVSLVRASHSFFWLAKILT
jgi:hypothetical protein